MGDGPDAAPGGDTGTECTPAPATEPGLVAIPQGTVRGHQQGDTWAFLGIPFAAPPVGDLRWKPPIKPACSSEVHEAASFAPRCLQLDANGQSTGSEDCLYVNVWTPQSATADSALPVMVFVHGGGNMNGSAFADGGTGVPTYDGQQLAERGQVIVVTLQYRLNVLGFLQTAALETESANHAAGNYGLLDQIAAFRWVHDNVRAFGGDPSRVLLFGESGGGTDTCALYASPLAAGLFSSVIMESGGCGAHTRDTQVAWSDSVVAKTSCVSSADVLACLRAMHGADLMAALAATGPQAVDANGHFVTPAAPTIDGYVLPQAPIDLIRAGAHNHVPFVVGINDAETSSRIFKIPALTEAQYVARVRAGFQPAIADQVLARYPVTNFATPRDALVAVTTDEQFICPGREIAAAAAAAQTQPVYRYDYAHVFQGGSAALRAEGAAHGFELFSVFQKIESLPSYHPTADDLSLQAAMLGYWTRFAANQDPNDPAAVAWPRSDASDPYLQLDIPVVAKDHLRAAACDFWLGLPH